MSHPQNIRNVLIHVLARDIRDLLKTSQCISKLHKNYQTFSMIIFNAIIVESTMVANMFSECVMDMIFLRSSRITIFFRYF